MKILNINLIVATILSLSSSMIFAENSFSINKNNTFLKNGFRTPVYADISSNYIEAYKTNALDVKISVQVYRSSFLSMDLGYNKTGFHHAHKMKKDYKLEMHGPALDLLIMPDSDLYATYSVAIKEGAYESSKTKETDAIAKTKIDNNEHRLVLAYKVSKQYHIFAGGALNNMRYRGHLKNGPINEDYKPLNDTRNQKSSSYLLGIRLANFN